MRSPHCAAGFPPPAAGSVPKTGARRKTVRGGSCAARGISCDATGPVRCASAGDVDSCRAGDRFSVCSAGKSALVVSPLTVLSRKIRIASRARSGDHFSSAIRARIPDPGKAPAGSPAIRRWVSRAGNGERPIRCSCGCRAGTFCSFPAPRSASCGAAPRCASFAGAHPGCTAAACCAGFCPPERFSTGGSVCLRREFCGGTVSCSTYECRVCRTVRLVSLF